MKKERLDCLASQFQIRNSFNCTNSINDRKLNLRKIRYTFVKFYVVFVVAPLFAPALLKSRGACSRETKEPKIFLSLSTLGNFSPVEYWIK